MLWQMREAHLPQHILNQASAAGASMMASGQTLGKV